MNWWNNSNPNQYENSAYFQKWLSNVFKPCALVYSSPKAKSSIALNNLTPSEFLRPFGDFHGISISFSTSSSHTVHFTDFKLDFYDNDSYDKPINKSIDKFIIKAISNPKIQPQWYLHQPYITTKEYEPLLYHAQNYSFPWFNEAEETFFECIQFNEVELFQQPLITIYICSIHEDLNIINDMKKKQLPKLVSEGVYEENMVHLVILLNDKKDKKDKKLNEFIAGTQLTTFKSAFHSYPIYVFDINSQEVEDKMLLQDDIWEKYIHKVDMYNPDNNTNKNDINKVKTTRGRFISNQERDALKLQFIKFINTIFRPSIVKIVKELNDEVSSNRRINWKSFQSLFQKPIKSEQISYYQVYKLTPIEKKIYLLAMIQYYLRDYNGALVNYEFLYNDLKTKSIRHQNNCLQMMTLCQFLTTSNKRKIDFDAPYIAFNSTYDYQSAFRALMIQVKMLEQLRMFHELCSILSPAHSTHILQCFSFIKPLLIEKIGIYHLINGGKYRHFIINFCSASQCYQREDNYAYLPYAFYDLGAMYKFFDKIDHSFIRTKLMFNQQMKLFCKTITPNDNGIEHNEAAVIFSKNCIETLKYLEQSKENQSEFFKAFLKHLDEFNQETIFTDFAIPEIDNTSVIVIEEQDKVIYEELIKNDDDSKEENFEIKTNLGIDDEVLVNRDSNKIEESLQMEEPIITEDDIKEDEGIKETNNEKIDNEGNEKQQNEALQQQEQVNNKETIEIYSKFEKYTRVYVKPCYIPLTKNDITAMEFIDNLIAKKNMINFYLKRNYIVNTTKKVYVRLLMYNPLNINLEISSFKLLLDISPILTNESQSTLINESIDFIIDPLSTKTIQISFQLNQSGLVLIKGVEMKLFKIAIVHHLFSNQKLNQLYDYRAKHRQLMASRQNNNNNNKGRRNSNPNNSNIKQKTAYSITVLDSLKDFEIQFPQGQSITSYCNQLIMFPIVISNHTEYDVKKFTVFFFDEYDKENRSNKHLLCDYIHTIDWELSKKPKEIIVPIVPTVTGMIHIKIVIKFEDEFSYKELEAKRFLIDINVLSSISFDIKDKLLFWNEEYLDFSLKANSHIVNRQDFTIMKIDNVFIKSSYKFIQKATTEDNKSEGRKEKIILNNNPHADYWNIIDKDSYYKLYSDFLIRKYITADNDNNKDNPQSEHDFAFLSTYYHFNQPQPHITQIMNRMINEDHLLLHWSSKDKANKDITGLYIHKLSFQMPEMDADDIHILLSHLVDISIEQEPNTDSINNNETLVTITYSIHTKRIEQLKHFQSFSIEVDQSNSHYHWIGLKRFAYDRLISERLVGNDGKIEISFTFTTTLKGVIDANKLLFIFNFSDRLSDPVTVRNVPSFQTVEIK